MVFELSQGDQRVVHFDLTVNGNTLTPEALQELEICVQEQVFRKTMSAGEVAFVPEIECWAFLLTQEETFAIAPGSYSVEARPKFLSGLTKRVPIGHIWVTDTHSDEVI